MTVGYEGSMGVLPHVVQAEMEVLYVVREPSRSVMTVFWMIAIAGRGVVKTRVTVSWEIPVSVEAEVLVLVLKLELELKPVITPVFFPVALVPGLILDSRVCGTGLPLWER